MKQTIATIILIISVILLFWLFIFAAYKVVYQIAENTQIQIEDNLL